MAARVLVAVLLGMVHLVADEVELNNGAAFSGAITAEDDHSVTIRLDQGGSMTFEKWQVAKIRRDGPGHDAAPPTTDLKTVEQGPLDDLVARVGPGGVTRKEFEVYLLIYARQYKREALSHQEKLIALGPAIDDELIFQAALAEGALEDEHVRWSVSKVYESSETAAKVDPESFSEEELRAYYDAHPDQFTDPAAVYLKGARIGSHEEEAAVVEAMGRGETPPGGMSDQGWLDASTQAPLNEADRGKLLALQVGDVSPVIEIPGGIKMVYRCVERREPRTRSYEESRGRVKFLLLGEQVGDKKEELGAKLEGETADGTDEERLYRAALKKGYHRRPECRPYIINAYLERKKQKKEEAAAELRERFPVEVLLEE